MKNLQSKHSDTQLNISNEASMDNRIVDVISEG